MGEPFGLVVRFTLQDGAGPAFDHLVADTVERIRISEPGTLVYACHTVNDEPTTRIFYELYQDRAAFEQHESQPHIRRFLAERDQYVAHFDVTVLSLAAAKGVQHPENTR